MAKTRIEYRHHLDAESHEKFAGHKHDHVPLDVEDVDASYAEQMIAAGYAVEAPAATAKRAGGRSPRRPAASRKAKAAASASSSTE